MSYSKNELQAVMQLGESMGYGRMMQIASSLWAIALVDKHGLPPDGAFIPTIDSFMKKKEAERSVKERDWHIAAIREALKG